MYNKTCITCGSLPVTRIVGVREGYLSFNRKPKVPEPFSRPCKPVTCNFGVQTSCKNSPRSSPGKSGCSSKSSSKPSSKPCSKPSSKPSRKSSCSEEKQPGAITVCPDFCDRSDNSDDGRYNRDNREYRDKLDPRDTNARDKSNYSIMDGVHRMFTDDERSRQGRPPARNRGRSADRNRRDSPPAGSIDVRVPPPRRYRSESRGNRKRRGGRKGGNRFDT